jgi:hypothetical protein
MNKIKEKLEDNWLLMKYLNLSLKEIDIMENYKKEFLINEIKNKLKLI